VPTCVDNVENGNETDKDCGGSCRACADLLGCKVPGDCESGVCTNSVCQKPVCTDTVKNGVETDVDCGGATCGKCALDKRCAVHTDCLSTYCAAGFCKNPGCGDGVLNGLETDVDCGGGTCAKCALNKVCKIDTDCATGKCTSGKCTQSCTDGVKNGSETDVDCGGSCGKCAETKLCLVAADCLTGVCSNVNGVLKCTQSCTDAVKNGTETDIDCGGTCAADCLVGQGCKLGTDCVDQVCTSGKCTKTCADNVKNGTESDVDCGGSDDPLCARCAVGKVCTIDSDCAFRCYGGKCIDKYELVKDRGGVRMWNDTNAPYASSCETYIRPIDTNYVYRGQTGDGAYWVQPIPNLPAVQVWCDMTVDSGGWTMVLINSTYNGPVRPDWNTAVTGNTLNGSMANGLNGFDQLLGLNFWLALGNTMRLDQGGGPAEVNIVHRAYYKFSFDVNNWYKLQMSDGRVVKGGTVPDMYAYHNGRRFSTKDKDNDDCGGSCSISYGSGAWWYGCCWAGNFWGGNGSSHTANPYWTSSVNDYYSWGAIYVKNNGSAGDGSTKEKAGQSCKKIMADKLSRGNGIYWIDPNGGDVSDAYQVYCDMTSDGGGWTMVMKVNGASSNLVYGAGYWENATLLNVNNIAEDAVDSKFQSYVNLAFGEVMLKMKTGETWNRMQWAKAGNSMQAVMQGGHQTTGKTRAQWKAMMPSSSLQPYCNVEGFNTLKYGGGWWDTGYYGVMRQRLGIVANQENNCGSCDSRLGIGGGGSYCGPNSVASYAAGNFAYCSADAGDRSTQAIGYLYVR